MWHDAQVDGSVGYEWTQAATDGALAVPNPLDTAPDNTLDGLSALIFNLLTQDTAQQGSALNTLAGLVADSADRSLFLLNGDVCYARCAPHQYCRERGKSDMKDQATIPSVMVMNHPKQCFLGASTVSERWGRC